MLKRSVFWILLLSLAVGGATVNAQDEPLDIVASFTILADVAQNVAGDAAVVTSLMPAGADPHTFEPTPRDLTALADADVVFTNGAFFEEGLLEAIENAGAETLMVEASACVEILPFGVTGHDHGDEEHGDEDHDEEHGDEDHGDEQGHEGDMSAIAALCAAHHDEMAAIHEAGHEHDEDEMHAGEEHEDEASDHEHGEEGDHDEHEHSEVMTLGMLYTLDCGMGHDHEGEEAHDEEHDEGEEHSDEEHDHDHGSCDSHVWMEPHNAMYWAMLIRDTLIELDPANADTYTANAEAYLLELDALAHDVVMPMVETVPEENRVLVTNHESMGYFAARHGFEVVTTVIPGGGTAAEPSAAAIAEIIDTINAEGVPAIFVETTVSDAIAEQIATETGAELFLLYSGSLSEADGPAATYIDYITYNVTTIVTALGGSAG